MLGLPDGTGRKAKIQALAAGDKASAAHERVTELEARIRVLESGFAAQRVQIEALARAAIESGMSQDLIAKHMHIVADEHATAAEGPPPVVECPACSRPNRETAKKCMYCGAELPPAIPGGSF